MFASLRRDSPKILRKEILRRDPLTHWVTILRYLSDFKKISWKNITFIEKDSLPKSRRVIFMNFAIWSDWRCPFSTCTLNFAFFFKQSPLRLNFWLYFLSQFIIEWFLGLLSPRSEFFRRSRIFGECSRNRQKLHARKFSEKNHV